ncbi:MAG: carbamate kinase [Deltaproteobacteria bacterium]|nr:carbamate kinase [Deltaproteobacteria bacterium]
MTSIPPPRPRVVLPRGSEGRRRVVILGAAGRDFHVFETVYRDDPRSEVVAFCAAQIPGIAGRTFPPSLAGTRYPKGIPIVSEDALERLMSEQQVDTVVFAYSDVSHEDVMHLASRALAAGADFVLHGPDRTMLKSRKPVVAVTAVRTGCGKTPVARLIASILERHGLRVVIVRHPMPYGDLEAERVQRFQSRHDLVRYDTTIEEREEYETHLEAGRVVYAGVDYREILHRAEDEADVVLWDGGNNDFSFFAADLTFVVTDPLRPDDTLRYHPGETCLRLADVVVINKVDAASAAGLALVRADIDRVRPGIPIVTARSTLHVDGNIAGRRVVVVEDGPTLTHGGMTHGAGTAAARLHGAEIVDPRPHAVGSLAILMSEHPDLRPLIPATGYGPRQVAELEATLRAVPADLVLSATPMDLGALIRVDKPIVRVRYSVEPVGGPDLDALLDPIVARAISARARGTASKGAVEEPSEGAPRRRYVVALGGNALIRRGEKGDFALQREHVLSAARAIAGVLERGHDVVITHGNGPQIGFLALQAQAAEPAVPAPPLDVLGAESQAQIGYMLEQALRDALRDRNISREVVTVVTQVVVDEAGLRKPVKPIGPVYDEATATRLAKEHGWTVAKDGDGWRRSVPSPRPKRVVEIQTVRDLVQSGAIVIACGGGGVPVVEHEGRLRGVEAVIDKDLSATLLALAIDADELVMLTDVEGVYRDYRSESPELLRELSAGQIDVWLNAKSLEQGSMEPKCRAAMEFVLCGGSVARIGALDHAVEVVAGTAGTRVKVR